MDGRETAAMDGSSTWRGKWRLFTPFPAVSQLLPVMQIHFRSHADIYTHSISLLYGILRHSGLSRALSKYFRFSNSTSGTTPETGNGMPTSLFHYRQRLYHSSAASRDFTPTVSKMAAKTSSGSGFDRKFKLVAPGFRI